MTRRCRTAMSAAFLFVDTPAVTPKISGKSLHECHKWDIDSAKRFDYHKGQLGVPEFKEETGYIVKQRFLKFMAGRYGADQLSRTLSYVALGLMVVCLFLNGVANLILWLVALACIAVCYFRMFSKNIGKRYLENQKYLALQNRMIGWFKRRREMFSQRRTHRFFRCPQCSATARVPKGKGRIRITCPKCSCVYERKS